MVNKKIAIIFMLFIFFLLIGCGSPNISKTKTEIIQDDVLAYISHQEDNSVGDLYLIGENEERKKISSNMLQDAFEFLPSSKALLYIDENDTFYYQGIEGDKIAITDDVKPSSIVVSGNEKTFAYLKGNKWDLYIQRIEDGEILDRVKVASDISYDRYILSYDGNKIIYLNNEDTLYIKEGTETPKRIASNVYYFDYSEDNNTIWFVNNDLDFYSRKIEEDDNKKIKGNNIALFTISASGKNIVYLADFNYEQYKGELYYLMDGREPQWLASDVIDYRLSDDGNELYFINCDLDLFYRKIGEDRNHLVASEVYWVIPNFENKKVLYTTNDDALYLSNLKDDSKKIADDVM